MHPAFSVIFFTTASGAGYGLLALLGLFGAAGLLPPDRGFGVAGFGIGFVLVTLGLLSSTFHLGHPERAWRALTQWRSSWLSREGVLAILTYVPTGLYASSWVFLGRNDGAFALLAIAGALLCGLTVYCTAMIYASLKPVRRWSNPWVVPAYLLLGLATGALLLDLLTRAFGLGAPHFTVLAVAALLLAGGMKAAYWRSIAAETGGSTVASATGLGRPGGVKLLDAPHTEANYLMQEMGFRIARKHANRLRRISALTLFAIPVFLLVASLAVAAGAALAFSTLALLSAGLGVVVERWLFFAEARHTVMLYYGAEDA